MTNHKLQRLCVVFIWLLCMRPAFSDDISFSSEKMSGRGNSNDVATVLSGNAIVQTADMKIKSDVIELSGKDFTRILARGSVEGENEKDQFSFSADVLQYDREKKISEFFGNVKYIDKKNDTVVIGDYARYDEKSEILIIKFNVRITQNDKKCKAMFASYKRKSSLVELVGKPEVTDKDDTFRASRISINLDTDDIQLQGKVSGTIIEKEEHE